MLSPLAEILAFFGELSARRILGFILLLLFSLIGLMVFEQQTAWFALGRLEHAQKILNEVAAAERAETKPETLALQTKIKAQVAEIIERPALSVYIQQVLEGSARDLILRFVGGALPWLVLALTGLNDVGKKGGWSAVAALGLVALLFGAFSVVMPGMGPEWLRYWVLPWIVFFIFLGVVAGIAVAKMSTQQKAILNNLKQLDAAFDQYALENGVTSATYEQIVGPQGVLRDLVPVAGEDYRAVRLDTQAPEFAVTTPEGLTVRLSRSYSIPTK